MDTNQKRYTRLEIGRNDIVAASKHTTAEDDGLASNTPNKLRKIQSRDEKKVYIPFIDSLKEKPVRSESPWLHFDKSPIEALDLSGNVIIARSKASPKTIVGLRAYPRDQATELLPRFRKLQHQNIPHALEAFITNKILYLVFEDICLTLEHLVLSPAYPSSLQLGTILGQILDGLGYLEQNGLGHGYLECENILLTSGGCIKVAKQELCQPISQESTTNDIKGFGRITMKLMQKMDRDDGTIGIDDPSRWSDNYNVIGFASTITSVQALSEMRLVSLDLEACSSSLANVMKHPFISGIWEKNYCWEGKVLWDLIVTAQYSVRRYYAYRSPS